MNVKELRDILQGHKDETEIRLGAWRVNSSGGLGYYDYSPLSERNVLFDVMAGKTVIMIETDV